MQVTVFFFLLLGLLGHVFVEIKQSGVFLLCPGRNTPEECILYITGGVGWEALQGKAEIPKKHGVDSIFSPFNILLQWIPAILECNMIC